VSPRSLLLAVFAVISFGGIVILVAMPPREPPTYRISPDAAGWLEASPVPQPAALFVGDSYAHGDAAAGPRSSFPTLTAQAMGWACSLDAEGSTGYLANGHLISKEFAPYAGRLAADKRKYRADYVIVSGGRNDVGRPGFARAVNTYLRAVKRTYPRARLIVLEPMWHDADPPAEMLEKKSTVRSIARSLGAVVIGTDGWLTEDYLADDGIHPSVTGQKRIAEHLVRALKAAGSTIWRPGMRSDQDLG